jgi:hypothetical protein
LGHIPGNAPPVEGLQRKLGPFTFWANPAFPHGLEDAKQRSYFAPSSMVNRVLTSPYLWWFDPVLADLMGRSAALKVLAFS